jgi:hypothetical protein
MKKIQEYFGESGVAVGGGGGGGGGLGVFEGFY